MNKYKVRWFAQYASTHILECTSNHCAIQRHNFDNPNFLHSKTNSQRAPQSSCDQTPGSNYHTFRCNFTATLCQDEELNTYLPRNNRGYLDIVQFEHDEEGHIYKMSKTLIIDFKNMV